MAFALSLMRPNGLILDHFGGLVMSENYACHLLLKVFLEDQPRSLAIVSDPPNPWDRPDDPTKGGPKEHRKAGHMGCQTSVTQLAQNRYTPSNGLMEVDNSLLEYDCSSTKQGVVHFHHCFKGV